MKVPAIISQLSASATSKILPQAINFFYFFVVAVWIPKSDLGIYAFCVAAAMFASELTTCGTGPVIVRRIAAKASSLDIISGNGLFQRLTFPLVLALLLLPLLFLSPYPVEHLPLVALAFAACTMGQVAGFIKQLLIAEQWFWHFAWAEQAGLIARVAAGLLLVYLGYGAFGLILGLLIGYSADVLISGVIAVRTLGISLLPRLNLSEMRALLKEGLPLLGIAIFNQALARADWLIMGAVRTAAETGEYAFAYRVFEVSGLPHAILGTLLLPKLSSALKGSKPDFNLRTKLASLHRVMVAISIILPLIMVLIWTPVVDYLTDGKYGNVNKLVIMVFGIAIPFAAPTGLFWNAAVALKKTSIVLFASCVCSLLSIGMNLLLIPHFGGIGAAVATAMPVIVQYSIYAWCLRDLFYMRTALMGFLYCLAAGLIAFFAATAVHVHCLIQAVIALLVYTASMPLIFGMSFSEARNLIGVDSPKNYVTDTVKEKN